MGETIEKDTRVAISIPAVYMCRWSFWYFHHTVSTGILDSSLPYAVHSETLLRNILFVF